MDPIQVEEDRDAVAAFYRSQPLLFDSTRRSVSIGSWLYDMELIFQTCHIEAHLRVSLASRCFIGDSRLWWTTLGERQMPSRTWAHFRTVVLARYGPLPARGADEPIRDPDIYRDMRLTRYQRLSEDWHTYPGETMSHYCWRFQEAMLPYVPQDLPHPELEALVLLRNGVPSQIRQFVPSPTTEMTVGSLIDDILEAETIAQVVRTDGHAGDAQVPAADDAGQGEPQYEAGPLFPEDPIPAVPVQEVPAQEAEDPMDDEDAAADDDVVPIDPPEDPPIIDISSDEEEIEIEADPEQGDGPEEDADDFPDEVPLDDDPEEILFEEADWDVAADSDSDVSSVTTLEIVV